jgi:hypothetical protein
MNHGRGFRQLTTAMSLRVYPSIHASGSVPGEWNSLRSGRWQKVIKRGTRGEVHYFEHASGQVAGVKHIER